MVFAEDIRRTILEIAQQRGPGKSFQTSEVAQAVDRQNWQLIIDHVSLVAMVLEKEGKIQTMESAGQVNLMQGGRRAFRKRT